MELYGNPKLRDEGLRLSSDKIEIHDLEHWRAPIPSGFRPLLPFLLPEVSLETQGNNLDHTKCMGMHIRLCLRGLVRQVDAKVFVLP